MRYLDQEVAVMLVHPVIERVFDNLARFDYAEVPPKFYEEILQEVVFDYADLDLVG